MTLEQRNEWLETQLHLLTTRVQELERHKELMRQGLIHCMINEDINKVREMAQGILEEVGK